MKKITTTLFVAGAFAIAARGQGFLNLDFESAYNLPGNPGENGMLVPASNALPDWTAYDVDESQFNVYYASNHLSGTEASVGLEGGSAALSGSFSAALYEDGSISQTGLVPAHAESLEFEAQGPGPEGSIELTDLSVTLGGQVVAYTVLSEGPNYSVYGANIPANMDGQTESLVFSCEGVGSGNAVLDNIEFSTSSVPEPGEGALVGLGAFLVAIHRRRSPGR